MKTPNFRTPPQMAAVYRELNRKGVEPPYLVKVADGDKKIIFFGAQHKNNPKDAQFKTLNRLWADFLKSTTKRRSIVFHEGFHWPKESSIKTTIEKHGEPGYTVYLAEKAGRKCVSGEPNRRMEAEMLRKKFGEDEVILYYLIRQIPQWQRERPQPDFENYLRYTLGQYKKGLGWGDEHFDLDRLKILFKEKTGVDLRRNLTKILQPLYYPYYSKVSAASSRFRNEYFFNLVKRYWNKGFSIFIVYGSGHAITLEPALKELGKR